MALTTDMLMNALFKKGETQVRLEWRNDYLK